MMGLTLTGCLAFLFSASTLLSLTTSPITRDVSSPGSSTSPRLVRARVMTSMFLRRIPSPAYMESSSSAIAFRVFSIPTMGRSLCGLRTPPDIGCPLITVVPDHQAGLALDRLYRSSHRRTPTCKDHNQRSPLPAHRKSLARQASPVQREHPPSP